MDDTLKTTFSNGLVFGISDQFLPLYHNLNMHVFHNIFSTKMGSMNTIHQNQLSMNLQMK